jgi:hypothetical protein
LDLPHLSQLAHEFVTKILQLRLEPNRVLERLNNLKAAYRIFQLVHCRHYVSPRRFVMSATPQLSKLAELRARTDRDLVSIIDNALEVGLLLAANEPDVDPEGVLHRRAADIYAETVMLVEKVENVRERRRLEDRIKQLRESLERR